MTTENKPAVPAALAGPAGSASRPTTHRPGNRHGQITDTGPLGQLAQLLRDWKATAGVTYRDMEKVANFTFGTLADAARGERLPSWEVTRGYLIGCGVGPDDAVMAEWQQFWADTQSALGGHLRALDLAAPMVRLGGVGGSGRPSRLRPMEPPLVEGTGWRPRPEKARTYAELRVEVVRLRIAAGGPTLRPLWRSIHDHNTLAAHYSVTTLNEVLSGKREPRDRTMFGQLITDLLRRSSAEYASDEENQPWRSPEVWRDAWTRAETNRQQPHLLPTRRVGNLMLVADDQQAGPVADIVAAWEPEFAAATLAQLPTVDAAAILQQLPTGKAQKLITLMRRMHSTTPTTTTSGKNRTDETTAMEPESDSGSIEAPPTAASTGTEQFARSTESWVSRPRRPAS